MINNNIININKEGIFLPIALVTALISAGGLILGSVIGAICSWFISKFSLHRYIHTAEESYAHIQDTQAYRNSSVPRHV